MSAGVPIVAEAKGGWREMLEYYGVLAKSPAHQAHEIARLAYDEQHRMGLITTGLQVLDEIANPETIGNQWLSMFQELDSKNSDGATRGRTSALTA
jgi:glycosyltransferase involved in cell wall biosynthesis